MCEYLFHDFNRKKTAAAMILCGSWGAILNMVSDEQNQSGLVLIVYDPCPDHPCIVCAMKLGTLW